MNWIPLQVGETGFQGVLPSPQREALRGPPVTRRVLRMRTLRLSESLVPGGRQDQTSLWRPRDQPGCLRLCRDPGRAESCSDRLPSPAPRAEAGRPGARTPVSRGRLTAVAPVSSSRHRRHEDARTGAGDAARGQPSWESGEPGRATRWPRYPPPSASVSPPRTPSSSRLLEGCLQVAVATHAL